MNILQKHEIFEIEVLNYLKSNQLLLPLVFGGGTMLRLCHDMSRYSADLDFWFVKEVSIDSYFQKFHKILQEKYDITDSQIKFHSILFEIRSADFPKRLKIEIRKELKDADFQDKIAYSRFSNIQVILKAHTLEQTMKNKINALHDRTEVRDAFDVEFLFRKGIPLPVLSKTEKVRLLKKIDSFNEKDFKVKLGSILDSQLRKFYIENNFSFLKEKLED